MNKNIRYVIMTLLACATVAFSVTQVASCDAHNAVVNAEAQNGYTPLPGEMTLNPGYWLVCVPGQNPTVLHMTQPTQEYTDPSLEITLVYLGINKPGSEQAKEACPA